MKRILITGANSYIGTSFEKYINKNFNDEYVINTVDTLDGEWKDKSFSGYDCVFHVAGIAHRKETKQNAKLYYEVNRDLATAVAKKAKDEGVKQFIFLSSMSVYGMYTGVITKDTQPNPKSNYGRSKLQAEEEIETLCDENFKVCILRPPMTYGKGCRGNFNAVRKLVEKYPIFPNVKNQRSMIYVDNLSSFVRLCVEKELSGLYFPQNKEFVSTVEMARVIARTMNKKVYFDYASGFAVRILRLFYPKAKKAFGTLIYDITDVEDYCVISNTESFRESVML